jgi:hypothetical protein
LDIAKGIVPGTEADMILPMKLTPLIVISSVTLFFAGCATAPEKSPAISVSAFAQANAAGLKKFEIVKNPRNQAQAEFEEIAAALQARLIGAGYVPADHAEAELTIFVNYLSDGSWKLLPVSEPELAMFSAYNNEAGISSRDSNATPAAMGTMSGLPRLTKTGFHIQQPPAVVSLVSVSIQAVPTAQYRRLAALPKEEWSKHPASAAWEIHAWYAGKGALEVRQVAPDIIRLIAPLFAQNSKGTLQIPYAFDGVAE